MFRFMRKILDGIDLGISLLRTAKLLKKSSPVHDRLAAEMSAYEQKHERRAWLKANRSAPAERPERPALPYATTGYLDALDILEKGKKLVYEKRAVQKANRSAAAERTEGLVVLDREVLSH
jgi:hypothetical protein